MGRRKRHNSDDYDDALERAWVKKRKKSVAYQNGNDRDDNAGVRSNKVVDETSAAHHGNKQTELPTPSTQQDEQKNEADKIERLRLKKQQKKQRQKEKKAEAARQAEEARKRKEQEKIQIQKMKRDEAAKKNDQKKFNDSKQSNQFKTMRKGVKYMDLKVGNGQVVQHRKKLRVAYTLRAKNHTNGKIIDASKNFGFRLGKGEVIEGYDIGLEGMRVGGIRRLIVPKQAAYHNDDIGAGRGADLFFEIELLYVAP